MQIKNQQLGAQINSGFLQNTQSDCLKLRPNDQILISGINRFPGLINRIYALLLLMELNIYKKRRGSENTSSSE